MPIQKRTNTCAQRSAGKIMGNWEERRSCGGGGESFIWNERFLAFKKCNRTMDGELGEPRVARSILRCRRGSGRCIVRVHVCEDRWKNSSDITGRARAACCGLMRCKNPEGTLEFQPHAILTALDSAPDVVTSLRRRAGGFSLPPLSLSPFGFLFIFHIRFNRDAPLAEARARLSHRNYASRRVIVSSRNRLCGRIIYTLHLTNGPTVCYKLLM